MHYTKIELIYYVEYNRCLKTKRVVFCFNFNKVSNKSVHNMKINKRHTQILHNKSNIKLNNP